jgi:glycosyltransferase involved in cell wall biosynthesis
VSAGGLRSSQRPCAIGFFGTFYPEFQKAGNSSTGLVLLLAQLGGVGRIEVFAQEGGRRPEGVDPAKVTVRPSWRHDDPVSLLRCLARMRAAAPRLDAFVFNIYVTSFGRSRAANATGLLLPGLLRRWTGRPVVVYMHNLLETQRAEELGYAPTVVTRAIVHSLEAFLLRSTVVFVPLESQADDVRRSFGVSPRARVIPFVESAYSATGFLAARAARPGASEPAHAGFRVLCFGNWGPQKDLDGALTALSELEERVPTVEVTVAGAANSNFPEYEARLRAWASRLTARRFRFVGKVPEEEVVPLFRRHDLLLLPYRSTGGYSGAMNAAALTGIEVLSYDLPQLRETAGELGVRCHFVPGGSPERLRSELERLAAGPRPPPPDIDATVVRALGRARGSVERLLREAGVLPEPPAPGVR